jgi:hypothetical protein
LAVRGFVGSRCARAGLWAERQAPFLLCRRQGDW